MVVNNAKPPILADCCSIYSGFAFKSEDLNAEGNGFPVIKIGEIQNGTVSEPTNSFFPEDLFVNKLQKYILKSGDTLIAMTGAGSVGRVGRMPTVTKPYLVNQRVAIVRPDEEVVHTKFIYYFLSQEFIERSLYDLGLGAGQPNISADDIGRTPIPLPPLPIQKKIAAILSAYDELIENNNRRIALLEKMAEEIYREWFVRMRFPGHEKTRFHKGIPEGWAVKKLGEVIQYYIGGGWGEENQIFSNTVGAYVIRGTDIPDLKMGKFDLPPYRYHKAAGYASRVMRPGDIVFEVSGGSKDQLLGRALLITEGIYKLCHETLISASFCKMIRPSISSLFLNYFLQAYYQCGAVGTYQTQSTGISNYQFESFIKYQTVVLPASHLIALFDKTVMSLVAEKDSIALSNRIVRETRDALLPRLMSGKLDVEKLDIAFPPGMQN